MLLLLQVLNTVLFFHGGRTGPKFCRMWTVLHLRIRFIKLEDLVYLGTLGNCGEFGTLRSRSELLVDTRL